MEWIRQNLIDRGKALDNFMNKRREIILELPKLHKSQKKTHHWKRKLLLSEKQRHLHGQLERITIETEQRLTEIRNRRTELLNPQSQSE